MDSAEVLSLVEHLGDNIDELQEQLEPLFSAALVTATKKLPLLDKAKLYVLIVYSIESLLFSYLRLNGINAKNHPVFRELTRVKQYYEKIRVAEEGPGKRENLSLNTHAASRIITHALAGNQKYDLERAEREAKERLMAKKRLQALDSNKKTKTIPDVEGSEDESEDQGDESENAEVREDPNAPTTTQHPSPEPDNGDGKKNSKQDIKRRTSKTQKRARKRKREQQASDVQGSKKKKKGKR